MIKIKISQTMWLQSLLQKAYFIDFINLIHIYNILDQRLKKYNKITKSRKKLLQKKKDM